MSALIKDTAGHQAGKSETPRAATGVGAMAAPAASQAEQLRRAVMTMVLVLYPAMATAAVVIAALVFSGAHPIV